MFILLHINLADLLCNHQPFHSSTYCKVFVSLEGLEPITSNLLPSTLALYWIWMYASSEENGNPLSNILFGLLSSDKVRNASIMWLIGVACLEEELHIKCTQPQVKLRSVLVVPESPDVWQLTCWPSAWYIETMELV